MRTNIGLIQILKRSDKIKELLAKGYPKSYIYNLLFGEGKLTISQKRFYQLLNELNMKNAVLHDLPFPRSIIQPDNMEKEYTGGAKEAKESQVKTTAGGKKYHKNFFPKKPDIASSFKRESLPQEDLF